MAIELLAEYAKEKKIHLTKLPSISFSESPKSKCWIKEYKMTNEAILLLAEGFSHLSSLLDETRLQAEVDRLEAEFNKHINQPTMWKSHTSSISNCAKDLLALTLETSYLKTYFPVVGEGIVQNLI